MKTLLLTLLAALCLAHASAAQCPFFKMYIDKGDAVMRTKNPDFEAAINAYSAAMIHCPDSADEARGKIVAVFKQIEELKNTVERQEKEIRSLYENSANEKLTAAQKGEHLAKDTPTQAQVRTTKHQVKKGETLWGIARQYNTSVAQIRKQNGLPPNAVVKSNDILNVPTGINLATSNTSINTSPQTSTEWGIVLSVDASKAGSDFELKNMRKLLGQYTVKQIFTGDKYYTYALTSASKKDKDSRQISTLTKRAVWPKIFYLPIP